MSIGSMDWFSEAIVRWYRIYGDRDLPWRATGDWWRKLLAIILLRRTPTRLVLRVYGGLVERLGSPLVVMESSTEELEELLRGLGLYRQRARQLKQLAEVVVGVYGGSLPCSYSELLKLPGVGEYTASEIMLTICRESSYPLLDTNTARVLERAVGLGRVGRQPYRDPRLQALARSLAPREAEKAIEFYYGLMDLARKICLPRKPLCTKCPLNKTCHYFKTHALKIG